jgi:hypothetical protein
MLGWRGKTASEKQAEKFGFVSICFPVFSGLYEV